MNYKKRFRISVKDTVKAFKYAFSSKKRGVIFSTSSIVSFLFFLFFSSPGFAIQMTKAGPEYWGYMVIYLAGGVLHVSGYVGLFLTIVYAVSVGAIITAIVGQLQFKEYDGAKGLLGVIPGIVVAGCAGCGTGIIGILGAFGVGSLLPFAGNGVRMLGLLVLFYSLQDTGDPRECRLNLTD